MDRRSYIQREERDNRYIVYPFPKRPNCFPTIHPTQQINSFPSIGFEMEEPACGPSSGTPVVELQEAPPPSKKKKFTFKRPTRMAKQSDHNTAVPDEMTVITTITTNSPDTVTMPSSSISSSPAHILQSNAMDEEREIQGQGVQRCSQGAEEKISLSPLQEGKWEMEESEEKGGGQLGGVEGWQGRGRLYTVNIDGVKDADETSFFIRSEKVYTSIVEEERKVRKEKRERKKRKSEDRLDGDWAGTGGGGYGGDCEGGGENQGMEVDGGSGRVRSKGKKSGSGRGMEANVVLLDSSDDKDDGGDYDSDYGLLDCKSVGDNLRDGGAGYGEDRNATVWRKKGRRGTHGISEMSVQKDVIRRKSLTPPPQVYVPPPQSAYRPPTTTLPALDSHVRTPIPGYSATTANNSHLPPSLSNRCLPGPGPITISIDSDSDDDNGSSNPADILPDLEARARALASPPPPATSSKLIRASAPTQNLTPNASHSTVASPIVTVLITSPLPNTRPLLAKIRLNQCLKHVRLAWCRYQRSPNISDKDIFLTYQGRKIFDANTFLGIGATTSEVREWDTEESLDWCSSGAASPDGMHNKNINKGIMFVAVDEEAFRQMREQAINRSDINIDMTDDNRASNTGSSSNKLLQLSTRSPSRAGSDIEILSRQIGTGPGASCGGSGSGSAPRYGGVRDSDDSDEEPGDGSSFRLILRGKDMDEFKIRVRPETKVARVIAILEKERPNLLTSTPGGRFMLKFDGDEVDSEGRVGDQEWEDKDVVEVWVR